MIDIKGMRGLLESIDQIDEEHSDALFVNSVSHGEIEFDITEPTNNGNLKSDIPTISISVEGETVILLTWDEARNLCTVLEEITDKAEHG